MVGYCSPVLNAGALLQHTDSVTASSGHLRDNSSCTPAPRFDRMVSASAGPFLPRAANNSGCLRNRAVLSSIPGPAVSVRLPVHNSLLTLRPVSFSVIVVHSHMVDCPSDCASLQHKEVV